jgi:protein-tyrosine phosphatase
MTSAPGRRLAGGLTRDLGADLAALRTDGVAMLVSLLPSYELTSLGIAELGGAAAAAGIAVVPLPIRDGHVPPDPEAVAEVVESVRAATARGADVVVHCRGGMGRTGTIAACCLVAEGMGGDEAIAAVRSVRPGAVETGMQEAWIRSFARRRAEAPGRPDSGAASSRRSHPPRERRS